MEKKEAKKGVELFELLSQDDALKRPDAPRRAPAPAAPSPEAALRRAEGRELVFGTDTAFVLFVGVLMLLGLAYYLGLQRGRAEQPDRPAEAVGEFETLAGATAAEGIEGAQPARIDLTGQEFTLKIRSTRDHSAPERERLEAHALYARRLLQTAGPEGASASVLLFDNGKVYSLGVGLFASKDDPGLRELRALFAEAEGPPTGGPAPYAAAVVARTALLGKAVAP